jgi:hypothetical protein
MSSMSVSFQPDAQLRKLVLDAITSAAGEQGDHTARRFELTGRAASRHWRVGSGDPQTTATSRPSITAWRDAGEHADCSRRAATSRQRESTRAWGCRGPGVASHMTRKQARSPPAACALREQQRGRVVGGALGAAGGGKVAWSPRQRQHPSRPLASTACPARRRRQSSAGWPVWSRPSSDSAPESPR